MGARVPSLYSTRVVRLESSLFGMKTQVWVYLLNIKDINLPKDLWR